MFKNVWTFDEDPSLDSISSHSEVVCSTDIAVLVAAVQVTAQVRSEVTRLKHARACVVEEGDSAFVHNARFPVMAHNARFSARLICAGLVGGRIYYSSVPQHASSNSKTVYSTKLKRIHCFKCALFTLQIIISKTFMAE